MTDGQLVLDGLSGVPTRYIGVRFPTWNGTYEIVERRGCWDTIEIASDSGERYRMVQTGWRTDMEYEALPEQGT